jgi:signal recognition particle GTPase
MKTGLYSNIAAKRKRIAEGSGEKMNKVGSKAAPSAKDFKQAAKTAKPKKK